MAVYQIYQFDDVSLPLYEPEAQHDAGPVESTLLRSIGGTFDAWGARRRMPGAQRLVVSGIYAAADGNVRLVDHAGNRIVDHAGNYIMLATPRGYLRRQVDAIRAKVGVRGTVYRRRWDDTTVVQWRTARLLAVRERGLAEQRAHYAKLDCEFETLDGVWRAATATSVTATLVSGGLVGVTLTAGGNAPVNDAVITITASGTITSVTVTGLHAGIALAWTGSLAAGQTLVIDCGAQTVLAAGADAYNGFKLESAHTAQGWLPIADSITSIAIGANGAGSVVVSWYDQWM